VEGTENDLFENWLPFSGVVLVAAEPEAITDFKSSGFIFEMALWISTKPKKKLQKSVLTHKRAAKRNYNKEKPKGTENRPRKLLWRLRNLDLEGDDLFSLPMAKKSSSTAAALDIFNFSSPLNCWDTLVFSGARWDERFGI